MLRAAMCVRDTLADGLMIWATQCILFLWFAEERPPSVTDSGVEDVDSSQASSRRTSSRYGSVFQVSGHNHASSFLVAAVD